MRFSCIPLLSLESLEKILFFLSSPPTLFLLTPCRRREHRITSHHVVRHLINRYPLPSTLRCIVCNVVRVGLTIGDSQRHSRVLSPLVRGCGEWYGGVEVEMQRAALGAAVSYINAGKASDGSQSVT